MAKNKLVIEEAPPEEVPAATVTMQFFGERPPFKIVVKSDEAFERVRNSDLTRASAELFRSHFQHMQRVRARLGGNRLSNESIHELVRTKD